MLHITSLNEGLELFKALGSDVRIEILNILLENDNMSMNELASRLNITNGAAPAVLPQWQLSGFRSAAAAWKAAGSPAAISHSG